MSPDATRLALSFSDDTRFRGTQRRVVALAVVYLVHVEGHVLPQGPSKARVFLS
jgi:hypothetical protein